MTGFSISLGPIAFIYISDILPDIGVGFCIGWMWVFTMVIGYFFPIFEKQYGIEVCFLIFAILSCIGLVFILF